ncbi:hypothetical protein [Prosthecobacter dejongeii]|uniref:Uncharacterized protein n=1 Tax=Prosthecobacter dejongeii TaxID=48465 RepID=A0A7W7YL97_9BACT|nr:hypothetical protein [Prosthecobacter dejongeii]MBB5038290.1 hypothetical protein [Prosthecobacter dejongeii]
MKSVPKVIPPIHGDLMAVQRGLAAAKIMARNLTAEHKRWQMPLLTWKQGQVIKVRVSGR